MALIGYARVSTQDQDLSVQLQALKRAGATKVYREKISGVRADRPELAKLMAALAPGDVVMVTKLDCLGRSTRELLDLIDRIGKAGASFRSLGDPLWDTGSAQGRLLSTLIAAIAEFEAQALRIPARRGYQAPCCWRAVGRDRQGLRGQRNDDLPPHVRAEPYCSPWSARGA
jgi:DNA invertase Pin-like site-specific DNA recombinase